MLDQRDWLQMELAELTLSREDFPAKTCPSQESAPACPVSAAACGPSFSELSLRFDPVGQSLKMSLGLELSALTGCSMTWQEQVTPLGRWWWVLSMQEHRTDGSGFGLWRLIKTTCGNSVLVDEEDYSRVAEARWRTLKTGYVYTKIQRKTVLLHRFLMNAPQGMDVDHLNHDPLDNRKSNLRLVPHYVNTHNRKKLSGVHKPKGRNKWKAIIYINNERRYLGSFSTEQEARTAYENAKARAGLQKPMMLPTPSAQTYGRNKGGQNPDGPERPSLETMAKGGMLPTPNATDHKGPSTRSPGKERPASDDDLPTRIKRSGTGQGHLSAEFVSWMMNYPQGWTEVD